MNDSPLRASVQRGAPTVRALLVDPDCEGLGSFASGIWLSIARLRELNEQTGMVCRHLHTIW